MTASSAEGEREALATQLRMQLLPSSRLTFSPYRHGMQKVPYRHVVGASWKAYSLQCDGHHDVGWGIIMAWDCQPSAQSSVVQTRATGRELQAAPQALCAVQRTQATPPSGGCIRAIAMAVHLARGNAVAEVSWCSNM